MTKTILIYQSKGIKRNTKSFADIKGIFLAIILILISVSDLFSIGLFDYVDDIMAAFCLLSLVFYSFYKKNCIYLLLLGGLFITGYIGNLISGYSVSKILIIEDYFFAFKHLFVAFYCVFCFPNINKKKTMKVLDVYSKIMTILMFVVCFIQHMQGASRAGFYTSYSGYSGLYAFLFFMINLYSFYKSKSKKIYLLLALLNIAVVFFSGSTTALFGLGLVVFFYIAHVLKKKGYSFLIPIILIIAIGVAFAAFQEKIMGYFMNTSAPRRMMYDEAIALANQYFPVGSGMGLFGGKIAANYYSPLYVYVGWETLYTMGPDSTFLLDTYFPTVLGEFGYLGCGIYIVSLVFVARKTLIKKNRGQNHFYQRFCLIIFLFLLGSMLSFNCINSGLGISLTIFARLFYEDNGTRRRKTI